MRNLKRTKGTNGLTKNYDSFRIFQTNYNFSV